LKKKIIRDEFGKFCNGSNTSGMLGKRHSETTKQKISLMKKGKNTSPETQFKICHNKGISTRFKNGHLAWNKNKPHLVKERNPNWQGGKSYEPYPVTFNKQFKEAIKQRDNFSCLKCNMFEEDVKKIYKQGLHTHHINYNKSLTIPENCCSLCCRCNLEVNINKKHWIKFFQSLLSERYGYKYNNQEIIVNITREVH